MQNKEEFIKIIQANSGIIHKAAAMYTSNPQDKEDLRQEIIYQLWKSFDTFKHNSSISTWMYKVAMNVAIYYLKKAKRNPVTIPINQEVLNISTPENTKNQEKWKKIQQHINNLSLLEKGIILLHLEGKSYQEISEIIGITESNVGTKLTRIKTKLKNKISNK